MAHKKPLALAAAAFFAAVLVLGACLSRDSDDEAIYAGLASKIRASALSSYNLRGLSIDSAGKFWRIAPDEKANFLKLMERSGLYYYDTPLFFNPPLFPAILCLAHEALCPNLHYVVLKQGEPFGFYADQLYVTLPNALFSVLFLGGVYVLGRRRFGGSAGLVAALLCLASPVFLVTLFKTWSDLMAAAFVVWSYVVWEDGEGGWDNSAAAGVLFALALLTRTSSVFASVLFVPWPRAGKRWRSFLVWAVPVALLAGPWYYAVAVVHGTPFYFPQAKGARESMGWLASISRPWYFYLFDLAYLSPFFVAAFFAVRKDTLRLFLWFAAFLVPLSFLLYTDRPLGLEDRYLLPCYPALAVLAAGAWESLRRRFRGPFPALCLAALLLWSAGTGAYLVAARESLKFVPW